MAGILHMWHLYFIVHHRNIQNKNIESHTLIVSFLELLKVISRLRFCQPGTFIIMECMCSVSVCVCVCVCVRVCVLCVHAKSCPTICCTMDYSPPGSSIHGIFQQEYWSRLPFPSPGDFPNPGIKPASLCLLHWQEASLPAESSGKSRNNGLQP